MLTSQHTTPKRRSPKSSHRPVKTTHIATKTRSIHPHFTPTTRQTPYSHDRK